MFSILISFSALVCLCAGRPQEPPAVAAVAAAAHSEPIQIVNQTNENNPDGSFQFSFETANGIKIEEKGYLKDGENATKIQVIEGTASYTDIDGNPVLLKFIADENGYQPQGDHIPKAPDSQPADQSAAAAAQPTGLAAVEPQPAEPASAEPIS